MCLSLRNLQLCIRFLYINRVFFSRRGCAGAYRGTCFDGHLSSCRIRAYGKRDTWPEWAAQAEVHAAAPDLAPRTMGYVAIDDTDQPTTTFVGLSERVEGTPLSELDMLRPQHLSLASAALDRLHRLGFRHGDGHLGNFILGSSGLIRIIDYEQAVRNASCARDGCADKIFLTKADVEHLRNGTSLSMREAWHSAGAALGARRGAHSSLRRFFLDLRRTGRGRPN